MAMIMWQMYEMSDLDAIGATHNEAGPHKTHQHCEIEDAIAMYDQRHNLAIRTSFVGTENMRYSVGRIGELLVGHRLPIATRGKYRLGAVGSMLHLPVS